MRDLSFRNTRLIRVSNNFADFLDKDVKNFLSEFNPPTKKKREISRVKAADNLMSIFKHSTVFFNSNVFNKRKKKKFEFEFGGDLKF